MRVGRLVGSGGWKYAAGEVLLIVVGILIAVSVSDWQTRRADRKTEITILGELHTALSSDFEFLELRLNRFRQIEVSIEILLSHLRSRTLYADSLDSWIHIVSATNHPTELHKEVEASWDALDLPSRRKGGSS